MMESVPNRTKKIIRKATLIGSLAAIGFSPHQARSTAEAPHTIETQRVSELVNHLGIKGARVSYLKDGHAAEQEITLAQIKSGATIEIDGLILSAGPVGGSFVLEGSLESNPVDQKGTLMIREKMRKIFQNENNELRIRILEKAPHQTLTTYPIKVVYFGSQKDFFKHHPNIDHQITETIAGISELENLFQTRLSDSLNILEDKQHGATNINGHLFISADLLSELSPEDTKIIFRHEALHVIIKKRGYDTDINIERFFHKMATEGLNFSSFIDESNFYAPTDSIGGHSRENIREFLTTFINSVIEIDRLSANLDRDIRLTDKKDYEKKTFQKMTPEIRKDILKHYSEFLELLIKNPDHSLQESDKEISMYERALQQVQVLSRNQALVGK